MDGPSKFLLSVEGIRALYEYGLGWALKVPLRFMSTKGDGHPVLVIPGMGASDGSTNYVRTFLNDQGYKAHPWNMGRNFGPRQGMDKLLKQLSDKVKKISEESGGQQVSIVGWSLGGIYSREIAKICPDHVRQVITLGTPFKDINSGTNVTMLYELLSKDRSHKNPLIMERISAPPPVPFTSMYSKTDGVVHWECSIEDVGDQFDNIEVPGASHMGLGYNPISMYVIANRLANTRETWRPYKT